MIAPPPAAGHLPATLIPAARTMLSWQTMLADLALILFMVTAATLAPRPGAAPGRTRAPAPAAAPAATPPGTPASPWGEPLAVWRPSPGGPSLAAWLAQQAADPRQRLTILVRFAPGAPGPALAAAAALAASAGPAGAGARIAAEPASPAAPAQIAAMLSYDREAPPPPERSPPRLLR